MRMTFGSWIRAGSPVAQFWKILGAVFLVAVVTRGLLCVVAQHFGWSWFAEKPFVSARFWASCLFLAFGLAVGWAAMGVGKPQR